MELNKMSRKDTLSNIRDAVQLLLRQGYSQKAIAKAIGLDVTVSTIEKSAATLENKIQSTDKPDQIRWQIADEYKLLYDKAVELADSPALSDTNRILALNTAIKLLGQMAQLTGANAPIQIDNRLTINNDLQSMVQQFKANGEYRQQALGLLNQIGGPRFELPAGSPTIIIDESNIIDA
jgi:hypothetical protein